MMANEPSSWPAVKQQAQIAYEHVIDMDHLNAQGGTFVEHMPDFKEHVLPLLTTMKSYYIFHQVLVSHISSPRGMYETHFLFHFCCDHNTQLFSPPTLRNKGKP
jgi:hypothetical protein